LIWLSSPLETIHVYILTIAFGASFTSSTDAPYMQTIAVLLQGPVQFGSTRKVSDTPNCNLYTLVLPIKSLLRSISSRVVT
jgi:hypothetical protein